MTEYAGVVVEAPVTTVYHYRIPDKIAGKVRLGMRVEVPFGPRRLRGFCVEITSSCPLDPARIKDIGRAGPDDECVSPELLALTKWIADYYQTGWGQVLAAAVPSAVRKGKKQKTILYATLLVSCEEAREALVKLGKRAAKQAVALEYIIARQETAKDGEKISVTVAEVETHASAGRSSLQALASKELIELSHRPPHRELAQISESKKDLVLMPEQAAALQTITQALETRDFAAFLLHGVTGSGKTEVYLQALSHCLAQGRTALVLVPEISLTPQTVERFRSRAGEVAVLHSNMSAGERAEDWRRLQRGEVRVVVGARSAVFAPLPDLGLVIVDEEHERTFKQDNDPRYHARDVAVVRAKNSGAVVVLGSATPSLESWHNAQAKKYTLLSLPTRAGGAKPPTTAVVDMRTEWAIVKRMTLVSRALEQGLIKCLARKEQAILLLNRRGFNTFVQCKACGDSLKCPNCDISLTHHRQVNLLRCHYCDYASPPPRECPVCRAEALRFAGSGTERMEDVLAKMLPKARLLRMDSDTMTGRDSHATALAAFARGEYDILLGTQMVAKGLDFPNVTLVGVLSADSAINLPDFRSAEKTFQLITQVIGRSGRADKLGHAIVQAFQPEHYAVECALREDYKAFAKRELADRKPLRYPPFGRLLRVLLRGPDEAKVKTAITEVAQELQRIAPRPLMILGPVPCALTRLQQEYRYHLLVKGRSQKELAAMLRAANVASASKGKLRVTVDIDPVALL